MGATQPRRIEERVIRELGLALMLLGLALVQSAYVAPDTKLWASVRGRRIACHIAPIPFYLRGRGGSWIGSGALLVIAIVLIVVFVH